MTPGGVTSVVPSSLRHSLSGSCVTPQRLPPPPSPVTLMPWGTAPSCGPTRSWQGHWSWHRDTAPLVASGQVWPWRVPLPSGSPQLWGDHTPPRAAPLHQQGCSRMGGGGGWCHCARWWHVQPRCHHVPCPSPQGCADSSSPRVESQNP